MCRLGQVGRVNKFGEVSRQKISNGEIVGKSFAYRLSPILISREIVLFSETNTNWEGHQRSHLSRASAECIPAGVYRQEISNLTTRLTFTKLLSAQARFSGQLPNCPRRSDRETQALGADPGDRTQDFLHSKREHMHFA